MPKGVYTREKQPVEPRFWEKVDKNGPIPLECPELGPCWLWEAFKVHNGYGVFYPVHGDGIYAHRYSYELTNGKIPIGVELDHMCHTRACVNPNHLRGATHNDNAHNQGKRKHNTSGYKGVSKHKTQWRAQIMVNKTKMHIGLFPDKESAYAAYCEAAKKYHGEFANLG